MEYKFERYVDWIYDRGSSSGKHSLEKIRRLLDYFDNPQDKIKVIHVAGTNGKGSTCQYLAKIFSRKNKVGLFVSPYMTRINEAITINGQGISDEDFCDIIDRLIPYVDKLDQEGYHNTYFEVLTAIMYIYFYEKGVDLAIVEVGMGGSLDCTNIIKSPLASVITTISMDHVGILGDTIYEIADNKAGIIKKGRPVFLYPKEKDLYDIFEKKSEDMGAELFTFKKEDVRIDLLGIENNEFSFMGYEGIKTRLIGDHQIYNAALALMVADYFKDDFGIGRDDIYKGMLEAQNPGRLEMISKKPRVIVDGSHNKEAIDTLIKNLDKFDYDKLIVGFSILRDKDYDYIIDRLAQKADSMVITEIHDNPRAFSIDELEKITSKYFKNPVAIGDNREAYLYSKDIASEDDLVIWCGSLYLVSNIRMIEG